MKPSRELDLEIANKVMGLKNVHWNDHTIDEEGSEHIGGMYRNALVYQPYDDCPNLFVEVPLYSSDMTAAWEIVEKLKTIDPNIYHLSRALKLELRYQGSRHGWNASFDLENDHAGDDITYWHAESESPTLAICLAALKTKEN